MIDGWKNKEQYLKVYRFIGKESSALIVAGIFTGIALFAVEVTFAYVLQAFLVIMKVAPSIEAMNFPKWMPVETPLKFFGFVSVVLFARGTIRWLHGYLANSAVKIQLKHQRKRLVEWAFAAKSINTGEFITLYNNGTESVTSTLNSFQNIAILFSASAFIFLYLLKISVLVTFAGLVILGVLAFLLRTMDLPITRMGNSVTVIDDQINRTLMLNIKNLLLLQIYGTQSKEKTQTLEKIDQTTSNVIYYYRLLNLKSALPQTIGVILICGLCIVSVDRSWVPSGLMITYFYLFLQFVNNFSEVIRLLSTVTFYLPAAKQFAKWWANHSHDGIHNRFNPNPSTHVKPLPESVGWNFSNVSFEYPGTNQPVLRNFSLNVPANTCTVLLGESGSGKSTIISLALGLFQPTHGNISVSSASHPSTPLMNVQPELLLSVGYVGPESFLIEGTILENLMYGLVQVPTEAEIWKALETAECMFVDNFPNKLSHHITEQGQGLSAGQKQRLSFARALLRKPKILILDEATSNLDADTEEKLVNTLNKLKGSITILAVTHREALLKISDQTIKLESIYR